MVYSGIIQPYSGIFRISCNAWIFRKSAYSEFWNIQNLFIIASRRIFKTLSDLRKWLNPLKPWKFSLEHWHIENPGICRTLAHLKPDIYAEPSERFKMEIVKSYNYFAKVLSLVPSASLGTRLLKCSIIDLWHDSEYALLSYILFN